MAYYCSVWVVAANYLIDELDGSQKKAVEIGFIDKIIGIGTAHPLHKFVPNDLLLLVNCNLFLSISKAKIEVELLIFPNG